MPDITMPKLSDTMEEGKILRWLKAPGQPVQIGEVLVEVETDKADMEIEAEHAGVLREIKLQEGDTGPVGAVIAVVDDGTGASPPPPPEESAPAESAPPAEATPAPSAPTAPAPPAPKPAASPPPAAPATQAPTATGRLPKVSPLARTRAAELGVDPTALQGTGPAGRVTRKDVEEAARTHGGNGGNAPEATEAQTPTPGQPGSGTVTVRPPPVTRAPTTPPAATSGASGDVQRVPLSGMRAAIARRMTESKREAPHFYVSTVAAMDLAVQMRAAFKESGGDAAGVTYNHIVLKACADALAATPEMNARFAGDAIEILPEVNLGVATAVPEGLIVPVIHRADQISLFELAARARELAQKAKERSFSGNDLSGATFSVSNLGMFDVESFVAVINPPQAGILAVGSVAERPVVRDGELAVGHTVHMTVSCDHRAVDGARAAEFLGEVRARLENPMRLLIP